ncbi:Uncharacterised protein [Escherichia coli]|uniref:Uncharacterized protein n=1 Tax=Escherichia coli TaxID=562 RepID=A0A377CVN0_ECOLX|nr:Uncharacterised protein [Escherichia coli]
MIRPRSLSKIPQDLMFGFKRPAVNGNDDASYFFRKSICAMSSPA